MNTLHKLFLVLAVSLLTASCGTLTVISDNKRSSIEQRLISASIKGALKEIDLSALRYKTVFLEIESIGETGGSAINGGRGRMGFSLYGNAVSVPTTRTNNIYNVVPLNSNTTSRSIDGVESSSSSNVNTLGSTQTDSTNSVNTNTTGTTNGSSTSSSTSNIGGATNTSTSNTNTAVGGSTNSSTGNSSSTTTTGGTTTTQTGTNGNTTNIGGSTNTTTNNTTTNVGASTNTTTGSGTNTQNSTGTSATNGVSEGSQTSTSGTDQSGSSSQNTNTSSATNNNTDTFTPGPVSSEQITKGSGYEGKYGITYSGLGEAYAYTVSASDITILKESIKQYFLLNDVNVVLSPKDVRAASADIHVTMLASVFGSTRSRTDVIVYNNEQLEVTTSIEMIAVHRHNLGLVTPVQRGSYKAKYKEEYMGWVGPYNKPNERFTHGKADDVALVTFDDVAKKKLMRDQERNKLFNEISNGQQDAIQKLTFNLSQNIFLKKQREQIFSLQRQIESLTETGDKEPSNRSNIMPESELLSRNDDHLTIQLMASKDEAAVKAFIQEHQLHNNSYYYPTQRKDGVFYVLHYGYFTSFEQTQKVAEALPKVIQKKSPWVRTFKELKSLYRRPSE